jgi:hypothetical protein
VSDKEIKMGLKQLRKIAPKPVAPLDIEQQPNTPAEEAKEKKYLELHKIVRWPDADDQDDIFRPKMDKAPLEAPGVGKKEAVKPIKKVDEAHFTHKHNAKYDEPSYDEDGIDQYAEMHHTFLKHKYKTEDGKTYKHETSTKAHLRPSAIIDGKMMPGVPMADVRGVRFTKHDKLDKHLGKIHGVKEETDLDESEKDTHSILAKHDMEHTGDGIYHPNEEIGQWASGMKAQHENMHKSFVKAGFKPEGSTPGPGNHTFHTYSKGPETVHIGTKAVKLRGETQHHVTHAEREM